MENVKELSRAQVRDILLSAQLGMKSPLECLPRVNNITFDPATKAYIIDGLQQVCSPAKEFKSIASVVFAAQIADQASYQVQKTALISKALGAVASSVQTQNLDAFKASIQEATKVACGNLQKYNIETIPRQNAYHKDDLLLKLKNFRSERIVVGNNVLLLDRKGLKHILSRHHPSFWNGSTKTKQTFLFENMSIERIVDVIKKVLYENRQVIILQGTNDAYQLESTIKGITYVVGLSEGRVGQFYIKKVT